MKNLSRRTLSRFYAMLWVNVLWRARYVYGSLNWALSDGLWVTIYVLGVLAFTRPEQYSLVVPMVFWAVFAWTLISMPVWIIGNWVKFYIAMGVYEEHELAGVDHAVFLSLRVIPSLIITIPSVLVVMLFLYAVTGILPGAVNPVLLSACLILILVQATVYGLILPYLGLFTGTPAPLLDFFNFFLFIAGGIATPIASLPAPLQLFAIATPYSHPAELMRASIVANYKPYLGFLGEVFASTAYTLLLVLVFVVSRRLVTRKIRREGVKGIGRM